MPEAIPEKPDAKINRETLLLRAQQIIAGAVLATPDQITIRRMRKTKEGFYRVAFENKRSQNIMGEGMRERTAVLDLTFPIEVKPIAEVIEMCQKDERNMFLGIGSGLRDYPKKSNADPKESQRAFLVSDISYGLAPHDENFANFALPSRYMTPTSSLKEPWPERTHFFNALDYRAIPNNVFDTIQMVNVLTDPNVLTTPLAEGLRMLKPDTGEFVIMNELGPQSHSIFHTSFMIQSYGGIIGEVIFHARKEETHEQVGSDYSVVSQQIIDRLQKTYHISPQHFTNGLAEGSYCVIAKKSTSSEEKGVTFIAGEKEKISDNGN